MPVRTILLALALLLAAVPAAAQKKHASADSAPDATYELREVTEVPRPLNVEDLRRALEAGYPPTLRVMGVGGRVEVRFRLDARGVPHDLAVTRSTDARFDTPTMEAVRKLRFRPAMLDGKPVAVWVALPVEWSVSPEPAAPARPSQP